MALLVLLLDYHGELKSQGRKCPETCLLQFSSQETSFPLPCPPLMAVIMRVSVYRLRGLPNAPTTSE